MAEKTTQFVLAYSYYNQNSGRNVDTDKNNFGDLDDRNNYGEGPNGMRFCLVPQNGRVNPGKLFP